MPDLASLNAWERSRVHEAFTRCCGSDRWAARMADARPYADERDLLEHAEEVWWALEPVDWLQALSRDPRVKKSAASQGPATPEDELRAAAAEQIRVARARLEKLLKEAD